MTAAAAFPPEPPRLAALPADPLSGKKAVLMRARLSSPAKPSAAPGVAAAPTTPPARPSAAPAAVSRPPARPSAAPPPVLADAPTTPLPAKLVAAPMTPPMPPPSGGKRVLELSEQKQSPAETTGKRLCNATESSGWGVKPQPKSSAKPAALAASRAASLQKSVNDLCTALRATAELDEAAAAEAADELEKAALAFDRAEAAAATAAAAAASDAAAADAAAADAAAADAAAQQAAAQQAAAEAETLAEAEAEECAAAAWAVHDMQVARAHYERAAAAAEAAGAAAAGWHLAAYGGGSSSSSSSCRNIQAFPPARLGTSAFWAQFHGDARTEKKRRRAELHQSGDMPPKTWLPGPIAVGQACGQCHMRHFALGCSHSLCGVCCVPPCSWHLRQILGPR